jgi:hypothetical protein
MNDREEQLADAKPTEAEAGSYESPKIERILTPDDMEREVMFAGPAVTIGDIPG